MPEEGVVSGRRVHAAFDLDVYGVKMSRQPDPPAEFWLVYNKLKDGVDVVRHENDHACSIAVIPFGSAVVLDTRNYLQPMAMLRIRITHNLATREPACAAEQEALKLSWRSSASWELQQAGAGSEPELVPTPRHWPRQKAANAHG